MYVGSFDGNVYALNATTGALVWTSTVGGSMFSSPAVAGGNVFAASSAGTLYALDPATGAEQWGYAAPSAVALYASPTVADGVVYLGASNGVMYAVRASNGSLRWSYTASAQIESSAAVSGGLVLFGDDSGAANAVDAATGATRWSVAGPDELTGSTTVADGTAYFTGYNSTKVLSVGNGYSYATPPYGSYYGDVVVLDGTATVGDFQATALVHLTLPDASSSAMRAPAIRSLHPTLGDQR